MKGRSLPLSQISDPQALAESSAVESQAASSLSERESATTHSGSAAADPSLETAKHGRHLTFSDTLLLL